MNTAVYSWGLGTNGQLGHAVIKKQTNNVTSLADEYVQKEPRRMVKSRQFKALSCGKDFTLGLTHTGELLGWGNLSQVGVNNKQVLVPTAISLDQKFTLISAGSTHCAAIDADGQVYSWGSGHSSESSGWFSSQQIAVGGHLGHGNTTTVTAPKLIETFKTYGAKAINVACGDKHTLILTTDGEVLSCGTGENGLLGTGDTGQVLVPTSLQALVEHDIIAIATGTSHSLALTREGAVFSWGRNNLVGPHTGTSPLSFYCITKR
jgi:alpha-tubulin suppressor-like RCC1 family protein